MKIKLAGMRSDLLANAAALLKPAAKNPPEWTPITFFEAKVFDRDVVDVRFLDDLNDPSIHCINQDSIL